MMNELKKRLLKYLLYYSLIGYGTNFFIVIAQNFIMEYLLSVSEHEYFRNGAVNTRAGTAGMVFSFGIPLLIILWYNIPIIKGVFQETDEEKMSIIKRRIINTPIFVAAISFAGWGTSSSVFGWIAYNVGPDGNIILSVKVVFMNVLMSLVCFSMSYYLADAVNRRIVVPDLFPEGGLSRISGAMKIPIRVRFLILYVSISVTPVFVAGNMVIAGMQKESDYSRILPTFLILFSVLAIAWILTWMVSNYFTSPVKSITESAVHISAGDYDRTVQIVSNDEIGFLGEKINEMASGLKEKEFIKDTFGKAVDPKVRDHLLKGNISLGGEIKNVTVLFSDIRGFTSVSEQLSPEEIVRWLNRYFNRMSACVNRNGGFVNKFIGDAILAVFGAPAELENQAEKALQAALEMRNALVELNNEFAADNIPNIRIGIGIHSGPVIAGNIGSESRMEYTVIGDTVNTASRLEGLCKEFGKDLIISADVKKLISQNFGLSVSAPISVQIRGKTENQEIYFID